MNHEMKAGFGKADISPELPISTVYTQAADQLATRIESKLYARVSVFQKDNVKVALVSTDLIRLDSSHTERIKRRLTEKGLSPENILIAWTHTHTAPRPSPFGIEIGNYKEKEKEFLSRLENGIVCAVDAALEDLKPCKLGFAQKKVNVNVNRRQIGRMSDVNDLDAPTGLVDNNLGMLFMRQEGSSKDSVILNYAAHPLAMGKESRGVISSDYPGKLCDILEKSSFKFAQFFQGPAGNMNIKISGGPPVAMKAGRILANAVSEAAATTSVSATSVLKMESRKIQLPVDSLRMLLEKSEDTSFPSKAEKEWRRKALLKDPDAGSVETLIQSIEIGDMYIFALPGEQFAETGLAIKEKCGRQNCFVVSYANCGEVGYVPTRSAFPEGGYEVDAAYKYGDLIYRTSPDASDAFITASLEMIKSMK